MVRQPAISAAACPLCPRPRRVSTEKESGCNAEGCKVLHKLICTFHLNRVHSQAGRCFQIGGAVVNKTAALGRSLGHVEGEAVDGCIWLAQADVAGTDE